MTTRPGIVRRVIKFGAGVILAPVCVVLTETLWHVLRAAHPSDTILPAGALALTGGFLLWVLIFFVLPRPFRTYVLGHELTHAIWGLLMGARVSRLRVDRHAGSVHLSKSNFWVALAPYFFPFYTVLVVLAYTVAGCFADMHPWRLWWLAGIGLTWGFHFTFTVVALTLRQTDIREHGYLFSYTLIYAMNVLGIGLWVVTVSDVTVSAAVQRLEANSRRTANHLLVEVPGLWHRIGMVRRTTGSRASQGHSSDAAQGETSGR